MSTAKRVRMGGEDQIGGSALGVACGAPAVAVGLAAALVFGAPAGVAVSYGVLGGIGALFILAYAALPLAARVRGDVCSPFCRREYVRDSELPAAGAGAATAAHRLANSGVVEPEGVGGFTRPPRPGGDGGSGAGAGATAATAAEGEEGESKPMCANCLHGADHHTERSEDGLMCDVAVAIPHSDPVGGCPCERYIPQGTPCSAGGCGRDAVHYRVGKNGLAYDMCVDHFEEAEPYGPGYFRLTGGMGECSAGGCSAEAVRYMVYGGGGGGGGGYVCADHFAAAKAGLLADLNVRLAVPVSADHFAAAEAGGADDSAGGPGGRDERSGGGK